MRFPTSDGKIKYLGRKSAFSRTEWRGCIKPLHLLRREDLWLRRKKKQREGEEKKGEKASYTLLLFLFQFLSHKIPSPKNSREHSVQGRCAPCTTASDYEGEKEV
jgi:hypothetical protein